MAIQQLLMDAGAADVDQDLVMVDPVGLEVAADWRTLQSPETYVGYGQANGFAAGRGGAIRRAAGLCRAGWPAAERTGGSRARGRWPAMRPWRTSQAHASRSRFHARDVNLVMGPRDRGSGDPVPGLHRRRARDGGPWHRRGHRRHRHRDGQRTYQLIRQPGRDRRTPWSRSNSSRRGSRPTASRSAETRGDRRPVAGTRGIIRAVRP